MKDEGEEAEEGRRKKREEEGVDVYIYNCACMLCFMAGLCVKTHLHVYLAILMMTIIMANLHSIPHTTCERMLML